MDEAALLKAIAAEPRNLPLRLAYCDWLEERGDPRAEYIRLEEAARKVQPWFDEAWNSRWRRRELQVDCSAEWLRALGYERLYRPLVSFLPTTRPLRWRVMELLAEEWFGPPLLGGERGALAAAEQRLGVGLPAAMSEFHLLAGNRLDLWGYDNVNEWQLVERVIPPGSYPLIRFFSEEGADSGTFWYAVADGREDPEVYFHSWDRDSSSSFRSCGSFTEFAIVCLVRKAIADARYSPHFALYHFTPHDSWREPEELARSELDCLYGAAGRLTIFEGTDLLLAYFAGVDEAHIGAKTAAACDSLPPRLRDRVHEISARRQRAFGAP